MNICLSIKRQIYVYVCMQFFYIQAYLGDVAGLGPDHDNKANIEKSHNFLGSQCI